MQLCHGGISRAGLVCGVGILRAQSGHAGEMEVCHGHISRGGGLVARRGNSKEVLATLRNPAFVPLSVQRRGRSYSELTFNEATSATLGNFVPWDSYGMQVSHTLEFHRIGKSYDEEFQARPAGNWRDEDHKSPRDKIRYVKESQTEQQASHGMKVDA